jgi:hypothetical protein
VFLAAGYEGFGGWLARLRLEQTLGRVVLVSVSQCRSKTHQFELAAAPKKTQFLPGTGTSVPNRSLTRSYRSSMTSW